VSDTSDVIKIIVGILALLWPLISKALEAARESSEGTREPEPAPARRTLPAAVPAEPRPEAPPQVARSSEVEDEYAQERKALAQAVQELEQEARQLGESVRQEIANERFVEVLTEWLPREGARLREALRAGSGPIHYSFVQARVALGIVLTEVRELIRQRRDKQLLPLLGDVDRLAEACYAPVVAFARAEGLPLSSARPVARIAPFELSIWTGFAPTSLAPLFLPADFFRSALYWTAIAHEIGHDFLISVPGLRDRLGEELGLPDEYTGTVPLRLTEEGLAQSELVRVFGGWLEEFFCDVFGTLMCGPAYVATMVEVFSHKEVPAEVLVVPFLEDQGRYGPHPPGHLRVYVGTQVLRRAGFASEAERLLARWHERNPLEQTGGEAPLLFWVRGRYLGLPLALFEPIVQVLLDRLYNGPLRSLNGFGLSSISGLNYGVHLHAQTERARSTLLARGVPEVRDVRAIIAGAVLATLERPELGEQILLKARAAIPAVGTHERAPQGQGAAVLSGGGVLDLSPSAVTEALLLQELLARRPPVGRRSRTQATRAPSARRR
jgi:hypothetical protein